MRRMVLLACLWLVGLPGLAMEPKVRPPPATIPSIDVYGQWR